jgi:2-dehydro-3-deoxyphosphogluconate aldolase / (4S)-4-hydroxy-2-oxoglutarate aldolase
MEEYEQEVLQRIEAIRLVPVIKIENVADAIPLGEALLAGGLPVAEVTFRTEAAEEAIRTLYNTYSELLVGAGTVLSIDQVKRAVDAGAKFIVSPGFNPTVVEYCVGEGIPVTPGINNPTGIEMGLELGLSVLKFFPAEASGGLTLLKAMSAPYANVRFMPTGGITTQNLQTYLGFDRVLACGGSWMVKTDLIANGEFDQISALCREAVSLAGVAE